MKWVIELVVGIFKALFSTAMDHPIGLEEEVRDVAKSDRHPVNPDDMFKPGDF